MAWCGRNQAARAPLYARGGAKRAQWEDEAMAEIERTLDSPRAGADGPGPRLMSADTLQGDEVYNPADEKLGEITDIMIDVPSGRVAYAVMSVGGVLGLGDKLFAVPWSALRLDTERKCFRLNVSKERVENAPGFDKDHWPEMADAAWAEAVHGYYDAKPYWA
jgi:sporulation protein YlmC with PRC-barrel domain